MLQKRPLTATMLCAALLGATSSFAVAQGAPSAQDAQPQQYPAAQQKVEISDSDLALFVEAAQKVAGVQQSTQLEMQQAQSAEEAQAIQAEAQEEMMNAVRSLGMTVEEYNLISTQTQTDPELQERLQEML